MKRLQLMDQAEATRRPLKPAVNGGPKTAAAEKTVNGLSTNAGTLHLRLSYEDLSNHALASLATPITESL